MPAAPRRPFRARAGPEGVVAEVEGRAYLRADAQGRWAAWVLGGARARRAADGAVLAPRATGYEVLEGAPATRAHAVASRLAARLLARARREAADAAVHRALAAASAWAPARLEAERERARAAWPEPVPILPPHRYRDLVVMPATGCPNRRCSFCFFYRERPFRALDDEAFDAHLGAVAAVAGDLSGRDGVFLGSASAASLPDALLLDRMARVRARLGSPRRGFAAFADPDRSPRRTAADWRALAAAGLADLTLGLETGDPALREAAGKSPDLDGFARTVEAARAGGASVAVTVLLGLGGAQAAPSHRERTAAFVARLRLSPSDFVYLAPWTESDAACVADAERDAWKAALAGATAARVRPYLVERFAWLA